MATLVGWDLLIIIDFLPGPVLALEGPATVVLTQKVKKCSYGLLTKHGRQNALSTRTTTA